MSGRDGGRNPFSNPAARRAWDLHYGPNMTPMVDVVMVILVFFMASSAVLGPEWFLRSALPAQKGATAGEPPPVRIELAVSRVGGATLVDGAGLSGGSLRDLRTALKGALAGKPGTDAVVVLRPTDEVAYEDLVAVHEACAAVGISRVGMAPRQGAPR